MKIKTFGEVKENISRAVATRPVQVQEQKQVVNESRGDLDAYPKKPTDIWPGAPLHGAPWDHPRQTSYNLYSMPGKRAFAKDCVNMVWGAKMEYYGRRFRSLVYGITAAVVFLMVPMPFTFVGVPLAGFAVYYFYHAINGKGEFEVFKNFGTIKPIMVDHIGSPKYEPPNKWLRRMWIWK